MSLLKSLIYGDGIRGTVTNRVFVSSASDLPAPVGGVHTLEVNTLYEFCRDVDLNGNRIVCSQDTVIAGTSSESSSLASTGLVGTALITSEYTMPMRDIQITADVALDLDANGNAGQALDWRAVNFVDCGSVGTVANYNNFVMQSSVITNSGGITFDGTFGSVVFETSAIIPAASETGITIPSTADITRRIRISDSIFNASNGATGINVSTSASVLVEGYILDRVNFAGDGTYIAGVQFDDNKAWFSDCRGVENSREIGQYTMQGNATATTITATGTPVKVAGTTVVGSVIQKFAHTSNRLTYTGAVTRVFKITVTLSATAGNGNQIGFYIAKNGTTIDDSETYITANASGRLENGSVQTLIELSENDYIEVFTENNSATTNVTVEDLNVIVWTV